MFDIEYRGGNTIIITTKRSSLVIDANRSIFGHKDIIAKDGIELATEERLLTNSPDYRISLEGPGEYEVSDFVIRGMAARRNIDHDETSLNSCIYTIAIDNIRIAILGNIDPNLSESQIDDLGAVDILIVPVGGNGYTLDASSATKLTRIIDPKIVIPVHYRDSDIQYEVPQDDIQAFIDELKAPLREDKKLKIKSELSLPDSLEVFKLAFSK